MATTGFVATACSWGLGTLGVAGVAVVFVTEKLDILGLVVLALLFAASGLLGVVGMLASSVALVVSRGRGPSRARRFAILGFVLGLPTIAVGAGMVVFAWFAAAQWAKGLAAVH